jgi:hypothetical protein
MVSCYKFDKNVLSKLLASCGHLELKPRETGLDGVKFKKFESEQWAEPCLAIDWRR